MQIVLLSSKIAMAEAVVVEPVKPQAAQMNNE